jgi:uncharacterized SAM-binding protein YcdF (DUF218 family)
MLFLSKLIALFVLPLGLAIVCVAVALAIWRRRILSRSLGATALIVLWLASAPVVANWLNDGLETAYTAVPVDQQSKADAIVILGGIIGQGRTKDGVSDLGDPVDRIIHGWRLFRSGKANTIVVSGGNLPWLASSEPEALLIGKFLIELGVPQTSIITESESRNTHENAVNTAEILKRHNLRSALLVTSASHMPRAKATFEMTGIVVTPAPTDFRARRPLAQSVFDFLPDAGSLAGTTSALREWLGFSYYRWRGWL